MSTGKLVRDRIPELIVAEGRSPMVKALGGEALEKALYDKLAEEQAELLNATAPEEKLEELADLLEVLIALAARYDCDEDRLLALAARKRAERGGFTKGCFYCGELGPDRGE
jgi:predicted house-cleaning noncanonical NTP pyrophosphatase (MazG superfamily)